MVGAGELEKSLRWKEWAWRWPRVAVSVEETGFRDELNAENHR